MSSNISKCQTCCHCMAVNIKNVKNKKIICLIYPKIFDNLMVCNIDEKTGYPIVLKCTKYDQNFINEYKGE